MRPHPSNAAEQQIPLLTQKIAEMKQELDGAKIERAHTQHYDARAKTILETPSCETSRETIARIQVETDRLTKLYEEQENIRKERAEILKTMFETVYAAQAKLKEIPSLDENLFFNADEDDDDHVYPRAVPQQSSIQSIADLDIRERLSEDEDNDDQVTQSSREEGEAIDDAMQEDP